MLIECPSCHTRAKLPDSKEGAKVRCPNCSFVYVARPGGARGGGPRTSNTATPIMIGAGFVVLVVLLMFLMKGERTETASVVVEPPPEAPPPRRDSTGWGSAPVMLVRQIHDDAFGLKEFQLGRHIDVPRAWAVSQARHATDAEGEPEGADLSAAAPDPRAFQDLDPHERSLFQADILSTLQAAGNDNLVAAWRPVEGSVIVETDDHAVVRVQVAPRDAAMGVALRWVEWRLVRSGDNWKAYAWERWLSPEEQRAERVARSPRAQRQELSDGSIVYEAEPRPIPYPDDVPQELRTRIEGLIDRLIDLERRDQPQVRGELVDLGKIAIPPLLTRMYQLIEKGLTTDEDAMRVAQVDRTLFDITGFVTTWKPHEALGASKERQESGLRQWFSWYDRKFRRFEVAGEGPDLLEDLLAPKSEAEAREQERYRRAHEEALRDAARTREQGPR